MRTRSQDALEESSTRRNSMNAYFAVGGQPAWSPPAFVFGIVWAALYTCIAIVIWRTWRHLTPADRGTLIVNLACNAAWVPAFLYLSPGFALALMVPLVASAAGVERALWSKNTAGVVDKASAGLWTPYLAWLGFASILNAQVVFGWVKKAPTS